MKDVTFKVSGEYAYKMDSRRKSLKDFEESFELPMGEKGDILKHIKRTLIEPVLKKKDPKFTNVRTCGFTPETMSLFNEPVEVANNDHKAFDKKTGQPLNGYEVEVVSSETKDLPKPKRKTKA